MRLYWDKIRSSYTYVSLLYNTLLVCWGYSATLHPRIMRSLQLCGFSVLVLMVGTRQDVHVESGRITLMYSWVFPFPTIISSLKKTMLPMTTLCTGDMTVIFNGVELKLLIQIVEAKLCGQCSDHSIHMIQSFRFKTRCQLLLNV